MVGYKMVTILLLHVMLFCFTLFIVLLVGQECHKGKRATIFYRSGSVIRQHF